MASSRVPHWSFLFLLVLFIFPSLVSSLNSDGTLLLSFKYSVLDDPLNVLSNWNYDDESPCSWNGVTCTGFPDGIFNLTSVSRVVGLLLPSARLLGSLPSDLFLLPHLRHLDLSANLLNGSLPSSLSSSAELRVLSLAANEISGELPDLAAGDLADLQVLNLSDNALGGGIPGNLSLLPNLTVVSLRKNFISGEIPGGGFEQVRVFDLSSNLLNGTVPADLGVSRVQYLNLSYNNISGEIPADVGSRVPASAVVDLSFNNFTGGIPQSAALLAQKPAAFEGNPDLCGKPLKNLCTIPSTLSNPPNVSSSNLPESPPAFAAIPKTTADGGAAAGSGGHGSGGGGGFKPATIAAIVIGDLGGIGLLLVAFLYAYHIKKKKKREHHQQQMQEKQAVGFGPAKIATQPSPSPESKSRGLCCLRKKDSNTDEETSEATSSETEADEDQNDTAQKSQSQQNHQSATLVTVDGDVGLEMETLLKASAYILGATGTTIVYKAVLADGTALAVRRIGESSAVDKLKEFEATVRSIAKFKHPNLLRIWGFYWGPDEKLLIHDYAPNGSLANISFSSMHLLTL